MKWINKNCGKIVAGFPEGSACPACGFILETVASVSSTEDPEKTFETVVDSMKWAHTVPDTKNCAHANSRKGGAIAPSFPGIGEKLVRFELLKLLGRGGMGYVYLARDPMTDTQVAIKVLRQEFSVHPKIINYFMTEARHMYSMSHPSILKVLEVSESESGPFFVMPYIKGGNLRDRLGGAKALDRSEILSICTQVAKGLMYAHARGLIHRDLKPDNLLIDDREQAYITDFGLVRSFMDNSMLDVSQLTAEGTPAYMSPGVAAGHMEDTRCDIYAFGAMMYEMLTGKLPYNGPDVDSILEAIRCGPPPAIQKINPSADKHLISIAETAMARELRARYATMEDILQDLERVARGQAPNGSHGHSLRRNASPAMKILIPILTILLLVFVLLHFQHDSKQPRSPIEQPTQ